MIVGGSGVALVGAGGWYFFSRGDDGATDGWTTSHSDSRNSRQNAATTVDDDLEVLWETDVAADEYPLSGWSPLVVDETVYSIENRDETVYTVAYDLQTGSHEWEERGVVPMLVGSDLLYCYEIEVFNYYGYQDDSGIVAFDRTDGTQRWQNTTGRYFQSPLAYYDGTLYANGFGGSDDDYAIRIHAIDADTGDQQWEVREDDDDAVGIIGAVDETGIYQSTDFEIIARDPADGEFLWQTEDVEQIRFNSLFDRSIAVDDTHVYAVDEEQLVAFDKEEGRQQWQHTHDTRYGRSPVVTEETVCLTGDGVTYGIDSESGTVRWTIDEEEIEGDLFIFGADSERLHAAEIRRGRDHDSSLYLQINVETGQHTEITEVPQAWGPLLISNPAIADETIVAMYVENGGFVPTKLHVLG